ncbi:DUF3368 domain-containing protein [Candidatus Bipolaricaulota bacterium]|nr:DUF3368 domain-containing protein [Candidatus Bipolaricaulota bacterium]
MKVILDSGPLMALAKLNLLPLLKKLYGEVCIPEEVYHESVSQGKNRGYEDAQTIELFLNKQGWKPQEVESQEIDEELTQLNLDRGEMECISMAEAQQNSLVLLDDEYARSASRNRNIKVKGTLGILVDAFRENYIDLEELDFYLEQISNRDDIWISEELCEKVIQQVKNDHH